MGVRCFADDWEFEFNLRWIYEMDYLFGGSIALASRIAANNAAATASKAVLDRGRRDLNRLAAPGLPFPGTGRKKRFVKNTIYVFFIEVRITGFFGFGLFALLILPAVAVNFFIWL